MDYVKILACFCGTTYKLKLNARVTVAGLQIKLRKFLKMGESEALFIFWECGFFSSKKLYPSNTTMGAIAQENPHFDPLNCFVYKENCFGSDYFTVKYNYKCI